MRRRIFSHVVMMLAACILSLAAGAGGAAAAGGAVGDDGKFEGKTPLELLGQFAPADANFAKNYEKYLTRELGALVFGSEGDGTSHTLTRTIVVPPGVTYDGKGETVAAGPGVYEPAKGDQDEHQRPLFILAPGAGIKNVTIGSPALEGIHMMGDNALDNIVWLDVGEDAASVRTYFPGGKITIRNCKAYKAADKVFQFNTPCEVVIADFEGANVGKLVKHMSGPDAPFAIDLSNVKLTGVVSAVVQSGSKVIKVRQHNVTAEFTGRKEKPDRIFRDIPPQNVVAY